MNLRLALILVLFSCSPEDKSEIGISYPKAGHSLTDKELSQAYCGSCHLYPDPSLLPRAVWDDRILKDMGRRLGIVSPDFDPFRHLSMYDAYKVRQAVIYPFTML